MSALRNRELYLGTVDVAIGREAVDDTDLLVSISDPDKSNRAVAFRVGTGEVTRSDVSETDDFWLSIDLGCCWPEAELRLESRTSCGIPVTFPSDGRLT